MHTKMIAIAGLTLALIIPGMAQAAMTVTRLLKNNLRELTAADAEAIYRAAY